MSGFRSFDRLAQVYRFLEYLTMGHDLERTRFAFLPELSECRAILVLGEGDGRCLERLIALAPAARIDVLDISAAMLGRAAQRIAGSPAEARVTFRQADLLATELPRARYDAVVTLFFLDCFTPEQVAMLIARIEASLQSGARWLWADFTMPERGWPRLRARIWLAMLYAVFRWTTGLSARALPPVERVLAAHGWTAVIEKNFQHGLLRSALFRRPAV